MPDESMQHVNRNLLIAVAVLVTGLAAWSAMDSPSGDAAIGPHTGRARATAPAFASLSRDDATPTPPAAVVRAASADPEVQFQRYVDDKYRLLFRDVEGDAASVLRAALLEREGVVVRINTARQTSDAGLRQTLPALEARKLEYDRRIGGLLPSSALGAFEALKDSDIERFQVEDYAAGIENVAPLAEPDKQAILATKLAWRERFRRVLADSRLMAGDLTGSERVLAYREVSRALQDFQRGYLQEVRQYLYDDAQYALLSNYETTEYDAELAKLRGIAGLE